MHKFWACKANMQHHCNNWKCKHFMQETIDAHVLANKCEGPRELLIQGRSIASNASETLWFHMAKKCDEQFLKILFVQTLFVAYQSVLCWCFFMEPIRFKLENKIVRMFWWWLFCIVYVFFKNGFSESGELLSNKQAKKYNNKNTQTSLDDFISEAWTST